MAGTITKCAECGYPIAADFPGQRISCPMCSTLNEAISQVTISTPVFVGLVTFALGMFLGPSIVASSSEGRKWLEKKAKGQ